MPNKKTKIKPKVDETWQARSYIIHELTKQTRGQFLKEHYLTRDDMISSYTLKHKEELKELFPNASFDFLEMGSR